MTTPAVDVTSILPPDNGLRIGTCIGSDNTTTTVSVQGTVVVAGYLNSYAPMVGDQVAIMRCQSSWLVLGSVRGSAAVPRLVPTRLDSASPNSAVSAETVVITLPSMTFVSGRCYRVDWTGRINPSAANTASIRVRQTNLAGTSLGFWQEVFTSAVGRSLNGFFYVKRTASTDLVDVLVLTLAASGGATNTLTASADTVRLMEVQDCGAAENYVNAIAI
jgi:hypothetical protein